MNKHILITNDDGIGVAGLSAVVQAVKGMASVIVVVPCRDQSGLSHRITMKQSIRVEKIKSPWPWVEGVYVVDGTPADCVRLGVFTLSRRKVDLVIAGTNHGANMGEDVIYSGTVAAAREGAMLGIKSMAVSVAGKVFNGAPVPQVLRSCAIWMMKRPFTKGSFFNVNLPLNVDVRNAKTVFTKLGKRIYGTKYAIVKKTKRARSFMLKEHVSGLPIPGTDIRTVEQGNISITPLTLAFTHTRLLKKLKKTKQINAKFKI